MKFTTCWLAAVCAVGGTTLAVAAPPPAAASEAETRDLLMQEQQKDRIYKAVFPDLARARKAAISFHGQLLESNYRDGYLILELQDEERALLEQAGFVLSPATEYIAKRNALLQRLAERPGRPLLGRAAAAEADLGPDSIPSFPCYETVEETYTAAAGLATTYPKLATWTTVGSSWQKTQGLGGYDMRVLKLTSRRYRGDKPKLFINAAIHAREYVTAPLVLSFATQLLQGYGKDADSTWILDHHELHLLLHTNPDGRKRAETGTLWRKNTNQNYCGPTSSNRGADLNRNFSYGWNSTGGQGSSGNACSETYRGPSAGSEPEVQAVQNYVRTLWPDRRGPGSNDPAPSDTSGIHLDMHSYSELVLWPWGTTSTPAPNGTALQTLGRKFAWFNGYTPMQSIGLYPTDGTSDGVSYGELGVAAYTFEMGTSFFQSCNSYTNTIKPANLPALLYAAKVVRTPYITPGGPDVTSVSVSPSTKVNAGTPVTLNASATDTRFNNSEGTEPTQAIAAAEYYIDIPPWMPGAVAHSVAAADGTFNATTEALTATVATTGLSPGKHLVFVRARDASSAWGAFSAAFVRIK